LDLSLSPIEIFFELEYKIGSWCFEFENAIRSSLGLIFENLLVVEIDLTEGSNLNSKSLFTVEQEMISKNIITNLTTSN
jgi:hypothetical protein